MNGLEMSSDILAARGRATYAPLDNPDRRHEPDGVVPLPDKNPDKVTGFHETGTPRHEARTSVLLEAQGLVHGDRNDQYGAPAEEYTRTVGMVNAMLGAKLKEPLLPEDLAYIMVCLKLSRQINKPKRDSLTDAAGYCEVAQWIIDARSA
jgi:hypothetical protein